MGKNTACSRRTGSLFLVLFTVLFEIRAQESACVIYGPDAAFDKLPVKRISWERVHSQLRNATHPLTLENRTPATRRCILQPDPPLSMCQNFNDLACCNSAQTDTMKQKMELARIAFGECDACYQNLVKLWCLFTCSPEQPSFVTIVKGSDKPVASASFVVKGADATWLYDRKFANAFFDSCSAILWESGATVRDYFHTPEGFLQYQGDNNEDFPIEITVSETAGAYAEAESCQGVCKLCYVPPSPKAPAKQNTCMVGKVSCVVAGGIAAGVVALALALTLFRRRHHANELGTDPLVYTRA